MKIQTENASPIAVPHIERLSRLAWKVLREEGHAKPVNLIYCDDEWMRRLNLQFRGLDKTTDVLSFIYGDEELWGEIYVSTAKAMKQAPAWGNTYYQELRRLVVHGALHLSGHDHKKSKERQLMREREEHYLRSRA